jgi:hypothetical protein
VRPKLQDRSKTRPITAKLRKPQVWSWLHSLKIHTDKVQVMKQSASWPLSARRASGLRFFVQVPRITARFELPHE